MDLQYVALGIEVHSSSDGKYSRCWWCWCCISSCNISNPFHAAPNFPSTIRPKTPPTTPTMITRHLTSASISFNPFVRGGKTARIFASLLPPDARANGMKIVTTVLPRTSKVGGRVEVVFSALPSLAHPSTRRRQR